MDPNAALILLSAASGAGFMVTQRFLKSLPAAQATTLLFFVPPMAFTLAWLIIGTVPTWLDVVGGAVVIAGVALVQTTRRRDPKPAYPLPTSSATRSANSSG